MNYSRLKHFWPEKWDGQCVWAATTCWELLVQHHSSDYPTLGRARQRADEIDPDALQRLVMFKQRTPEARWRCKATTPPHCNAPRARNPCSFYKLRGRLNFMWKHHIRRILLLSIRFLILKGLQTGNLAEQGDLLKHIPLFKFFFVSVTVVYTLSRGLSENTTQYYLIISDWKPQLVMWCKAREESDSCARERGRCAWESYWPKLPWKNSKLCWNARRQFIFLQEKEIL